MNRTTRLILILSAAVALSLSATASQTESPPAADSPQLAAFKTAAAASVDGMAKLIQEMVDTVFSFGELGFQEVETSRYLTGILEKNGFTVRRGLSAIPTAWVATWGSGKPVIALGSDIDGIPLASQKPGVAYRDPMIPGAPGHGEGHNSGVPLNIVAALAVKQIMERNKIPGTLLLWPGVAEELLGSKAWFVRDGLFKDVDISLYAHVGSNLNVSWGAGGGTGLVSVEYSFAGESAHSANAPWRGRSALDAVELMNIGWNFRREHLRIQQRSHYVVTNGGNQPNVVPPAASVWYYFREIDYPHIKEMWDLGNNMAQGAALMTNTSWTSHILGTAWPQHMNKPVAEAIYTNIQKVGLPSWSEEDQILARAIQNEINAPEKDGLATELAKLEGPVKDEDNRGGGSDDIGDVSWNVPTVTLRFPANIPGLPGHNWANAIAMATPIAHKGVVSGAKVQAMTMLDVLMKPELVTQAWQYFRDVQTKDIKYRPFIAKDTPPATWLNKAALEQYRPEMKKYYYDPTRYKTYLEQLGIKYPTVRTNEIPQAARQQHATSTLRAAYLSTNPAQATKDPATGDLRGVAVDLARELARRRGVEATMIPLANAQAVIDTVQNGQADLGFVAYNPERAGPVEFSQPYMLVQQTFLVRQDSPIRSVRDIDRLNQRIGAGGGDSIALYLARNLKQAQLVEMAESTAGAAIQALSAGKLDAFGANRQRLTDALAGASGLRLLPDDLYGVEQTIIVPKASAENLTEVNEFIDDVRRSGFLRSAIDRSGIVGIAVAARVVR